MYKHLSELPRAEVRRRFRDYIEGEFPATECFILQRSMLGRDIDLYRIGKGEKNIISVGTHHATEYISAMALFKLILKMSECERENGSFFGMDIKLMLENFSFWFVPCLNPDGVDMHLSGAEASPLYERVVKMNGGTDFSDWQANARGVDLNHNYNFRFSEYKEIERKEGIAPGKTRYSGEHPESEPETSAMLGLVRSVSPSLIFSYHTQGEVIYPHYGNRKDGFRLSRSIARILSYELSAPEEHAAYGGLCDYTGEVLNIPSFTVELGYGKNPISLAELPAITEKLLKLYALLPTII